MGMFHLFQRLSMFGELMAVLVSQGLHTSICFFSFFFFSLFLPPSLYLFIGSPSAYFRHGFSSWLITRPRVMLCPRE